MVALVWSPETIHSVIIVVIYLILNLALNFFNKQVLGNHTQLHFTYPLFYTFSHQLASFLGVSLIFYIWPAQNTLSYSAFKQKRVWIITLGLLFIANIACNNASLVYIGLSINAISKSIIPLPTMILSYIIEKKQYDKRIMGAVVGMVFCAVVSAPTSQMTRGVNFS